MPDPVVNEPSTAEVVKEVLDAGKPPVQEEKPKEDVAEIPAVETPPPAAPQPVSKEEVAQINATLAKQTELLNTLLTKEDSKAKEQEWTVEQLRDAERKCWKGEYDSAEWMPLIAEKRIAIMMASKVKEVETRMETTSKTNEFKSQWDNGIIQAEKVFGKDVADAQSKLFKTAQNILLQDPTWIHYQRTGKTDGMDPKLQYKCFEIAHSRLVREEADAPKFTSKGGSKVSLGGQTLPKPDVQKIDDLERRAVESGNQHDWVMLSKASLERNRARQ